MALDFNKIIEDSNPHRFSIGQLEEIASEAHYASNYFDDLSEISAHLIHKFGFAPTSDEIKLMVAYHELLIKLHCES